MTKLPGLENHKPQKVQDGFDIIKATVNCGFEYARFEKTKDGQEYLGYELIVLGPTHIGRKLWKRFYLDNEGHMKKLANMIFTLLAIEVKEKEDITNCLDELITKVVKVRAWGWTPTEDVDGNEIPENKREARQQHLVKEVNEEVGASKF